MDNKLYKRTREFIDAQIVSSGTLYGVIDGDIKDVPTVISYEDLTNHPSINGVVLLKDKTAHELELQREMDSLSNLELDEIFKDMV